MGVNVSGAGVSAFVALIVAAVLVGVVVFARRKGYFRSRGALIALAAVVFVLIAYGMTGGFLPFI